MLVSKLRIIGSSMKRMIKGDCLPESANGGRQRTELNLKYRHRAKYIKEQRGWDRKKAPVRNHAATLTLSVPGRHGDDPVDSSFSHGADYGAHGLGVSRHSREHGGREAKAGHDHVLPFEMSLQTVCRENVCFHHLEAADRKQLEMNHVYPCLTPSSLLFGRWNDWSPLWPK